MIMIMKRFFLTTFFCLCGIKMEYLFVGFKAQHSKLHWHGHRCKMFSTAIYRLDNKDLTKINGMKFNIGLSTKLHVLEITVRTIFRGSKICGLWLQNFTLFISCELRIFITMKSKKEIGSKIILLISKLQKIECSIIYINRCIHRYHE